MDIGDARIVYINYLRNQYNREGGLYMQKSKCNVRMVRIFLASPGDTKNERDIAQRVIENMNSYLPETEGIYLAVHRFEDLIPTCRKNARTQDIINEDLNDCDMAIAIFSRTLGRNESTLEEIRQFIDQGLPVWIYFNTKKLSSRKQSPEVLRQLLAVNEFREEIESRLNAGVTYGEYDGPKDFKKKLKKHLNKFIQDLYDADDIQ